MPSGAVAAAVVPYAQVLERPHIWRVKVEYRFARLSKRAAAVKGRAQSSLGAQGSTAGREVGQDRAATLAAKAQWPDGFPSASA
jgi:hypothetical protein